MFSRRIQQRILPLSLPLFFFRTTLPFWPTLVKRRDFTLSLPSASPGERILRLSPVFCSNLHSTSPFWEHPESRERKEISGDGKVGANKALGMEFVWIVWEGSGLKVENTSGFTFSFSSAWGHLALRCDNCRGNYSKSLTVCRNTVRETTQDITTTKPLQTGF